MRQHYLVLACCSLLVLGAAPSRVATYVSGQIINPTDVTANEDTIYAYLQSGVDTYKAGSVNTTAILDGTITRTDVASGTFTTTEIADGTLLAIDFATGAVPSSVILDGTILNVDINSGAAIDFTKLATLTSGNLLVGNSSNAAASVSMSGDVAISNTGATTIQADSVALTTDTTGNYAAGDAEAGNATGLACTNCVAGTEMALGSDAQGDVMYYDGTDWARLGAGTSGYFLKTQGAGANPTWAANTSKTVVGASVASFTATQYLMFSSTSATETDVQFLTPVGGTLRNLYVNVTSQSSSQAQTITVRVNASNTSITCNTQAAAAGTCSDTSNTASVSAGDLISFTDNKTGTGVKISVELDPT